MPLRQNFKNYLGLSAIFIVSLLIIAHPASANYLYYYADGGYAALSTSLVSTGNIFANNQTTYGLVGSHLVSDTIDTGVSGDPLEINYYTSGPTKICASLNCGTVSAWFGTNGNVGIGTTNPTNGKLEVNGSITADATGTYGDLQMYRSGSNIAGNWPSSAMWGLGWGDGSNNVYLKGTDGGVANLVMNGGIKRSAHAAGYQIGSYNSVGSNDGKTNPIYVIGSNYQPTDTGLSNMYGIGFSHSNFWGGGKSTGWGLYQASAGTIYNTMSDGGIWTAGKLGVNGTASSTYALEVNGDVMANGWLRTYGDRGWYNETYQGGWYMSDSTWIRSYNNKNIYQNTGILRTDGELQVGSGGNRFYVNSAGKVGIGTTNPLSALSIGGNGNPIVGLHVEGYSYAIEGSSTDIGIQGSTTGTSSRAVNTTCSGSGCIGVYGGSNGTSGYGVYGNGRLYDFYAGGTGTNYGPFTGGHDVILSADFPKKAKLGLIVSVTGENKKRIEEGVLEISSTLPTVKLADKVNDVKVLGAFNGEHDKLGADWYKAKAGDRFGVINALGDGRVLVTDVNGPIEAGDYITTSEVPGYGMKQNDDLVHSYTLGKATEDVDWDKVTETVNWNGRDLKAYLIGVVYTSG